MRLLRAFWYCVRLAFYLLRLVLYALHAVFYLFARVLAMPALPLLLVLALWGLQDTAFVQNFTQGVANWFGDLMGDDWRALFMEWRVGFTAIVMFVGLTWAFSFFGGFFRPIAASLPAPRRPLMPMLPLFIPKHVVKTVRARTVVKAPGKSRFNGELALLAPKLPAEIQAVLVAKPPAAAPANSAATEEPPATESPAVPAEAPTQELHDAPEPVPASTRPTATKVPKRRAEVVPEAEREG